MSTFLQLCQRLRQEAGISGTGPTTVLAQTGEYKKIVDWILSAYEDIQNLHPEWDFLRSDLSFQTISGTNNYTKAAISLAEYGEWIPSSFRSYLTSAGATGEQYMTWVNWVDFRDTYEFGSNRTTTGNPRYIAQKPDTSLIMYPTPDGIYTITGEYYKRAQTMTANADEPIIPSKYHMIIMWRALMFYAGQYNAPELYSVGQTEYKRLLHRLENSKLQPIELGDPLA
jgi:hypothetical protein